MSSQAFDDIRILIIGPLTIPLEILPGESTRVVMEGGQVNVTKSGQTLSVTQGSGFTAGSASGRGAHGVYVNASVTANGSKGSASATIHRETAHASAGGDSNTADSSESVQAPSKITIHVLEGTAIRVKNYVNGQFQVGAIKGSLTIDQMVNTQIAVDEVSDAKIGMLVNCQGYIHATERVKSGMMVNCNVSID